MKYSGRLLKLRKAANPTNFKALAHKLLKLTEADEEVYQSVLTEACISAGRLRLYADCVNFGNEYREKFGDVPSSILKQMGISVVRGGLHEELASVQTLIDSKLSRAGLLEDMQDVDVNDLCTSLKRPAITPVPSKPNKRQHKIRYPKGFDAAKPGPLPDPERWLPKNERTKKGKAKKGPIVGSQGSATGLPLSSSAPSTAQFEASKTSTKNRKRK